MHRSVLMLAAAMLPAPLAAETSPYPPDGTLLEVSATGRVARVPDLVTIRAGVVSQGATAAAAGSANAALISRVVAALRAAGIEARDVSTAALQLQPQYEERAGSASRITGYQASNSVAVRFRDIARAGAVLDALVAQGANQIEGPNFAVADPEPALDAARTDAITRARARAELYARAAGLHVLRMVSISEDGENRGGSPPVMYRLAAAAAPTPVLAGETELSVTVAVRFILQ